MRSRTALSNARNLAYLTVGWNAIEGIIAIAAGAVASSTALIGFGVDSFIESSSGGVMLWRLHGRNQEDKEQLALRLVGWSLLLLAGYVLLDAARRLLQHAAPDVSVVGMALAGVSLIVMPWLARRKRRVAVVMKSGALAADSVQTSVCAYLSAILLVGLGLNAAFGWWWADPVAALAMVPLIVREGRSAAKGKACADCC